MLKAIDFIPDFKSSNNIDIEQPAGQARSQPGAETGRKLPAAPAATASFASIRDLRFEVIFPPKVYSEASFAKRCVHILISAYVHRIFWLSIWPLIRPLKIPFFSFEF